MNDILPKPKSQELVIDLAGDQAEESAQLTFELNSGHTYQILSRSLSKKKMLYERLAYLPNAALIASDGGLISNLTAQENILLPIQYHSITSDELALKRATNILQRLGVDREKVEPMLRLLPAHLSLFDRRLISFARVMLVEPEILICDSVFEGLTGTEISTIRQFDVLFHLYFPFRTSIFLDLDQTQGIISADKTFLLQ